MFGLRFLPLVALGACVMGGPSAWAQAPEGPEASAATGGEVLSKPAIEAVDTPKFSSRSADTLCAPFAWGLDQAEEWEKALARQAAQIDPGILMYTEPPAGTNMPILEPPENVDPEMIRPNDP